MALLIQRPQQTEYPEYYHTYMRQLPEQGDLFYLLEQQALDLRAMLLPITEEEAQVGYAEGKWSIKELLQHMIDSERIFAYRALCIARGEEAPLPGFDENRYAYNSMANIRLLRDMLEEYELVRKSNIYLFRSFTSDMLGYTGNANGKPITVRALIHIVAAHERHHMGILKERYLKLKS